MSYSIDGPSLVDEPKLSAPVDPLVERLVKRISEDQMLNRALAKVRWADSSTQARLRPAGVDVVACALARLLIVGKADRLAFALPRGAGPLPAMLGLYLVLWQKAQALRAREQGYSFVVAGSVSVATMRPDLRQLMRGLSFDSSNLSELIEPAKLVSLKQTNSRGLARRRAAAVLLRGGERIGLSQRAFLLFHRPLTMPPVAKGLIATMVIDTTGASHSAWEQAFERNLAADRTQLWLGELGDAAFERFCVDRAMPFVRFDWPVLAACAVLRQGASPLASTGLDLRAQTRQPIGWRVVSDEEREEEFAKVYDALRAMRKRGGADVPDALRIPYRVADLLSRLACPLNSYERAAGPNPYAAKVRTLMRLGEQVSEAAFVSLGWKQAFEDQWPVVMAALRNLVRFADDPKRCAKDDSMADRAMAALEAGDQVRVLCQTRAEALATRETLDGYGLSIKQGVRVASFEDRITWSGSSAQLTLLLSPPPPWHTALLLSGEHGRTEVLCYAHEVGRLRSAVRTAAVNYSGAFQNSRTADGLGLPTTGFAIATATPILNDLVVELTGYGRRSGAPPDVEGDPTAPDGDVSCWQELVGLYGQDLPLGRLGDETEDEATAYTGLACLVNFTDAQPVFFRDDVPVTVFRPDASDDEPSILSLLPRELAEGMTVVFLPGAQRSDLVGTLMDDWDEQLLMERQMFEPLFRAALEAAVGAIGLDELARLCGVTPATVGNWAAGTNWPQKPKNFQVILDVAKLPEATRAAAPIWRYFEHVRGAHRYIGRLLNEAVEEAVTLDSNRDTLEKLSRLVGRDLEDIFDQVEIVRVRSVSAPQTVPLSVCGQFLDPDDPHIHKEGFA